MIKDNLSMIVAIATGSRGIGYKNDLVWKCPEDMKWFKEFTTNKSVIMGRKTFESLNMPFGLPNRMNYVITSKWREMKSNNNVQYVPLDLILKYINQKEVIEQFVVIGGQEIYELFLPMTKHVWITEIPGSLINDGQEFDTFFPILDESFGLMGEVDRGSGITNYYVNGYTG